MLNIRIEAKLESGTLLTLSQSQLDQVSKFVSDLVLGSKPVQKPVRVFRKGKKYSWSKEQREKMLELILLVRDGAKSHGSLRSHLKQFQRVHAPERTVASCSAMFYLMQSQLQKKPAYQAGYLS